MGLLSALGRMGGRRAGAPPAESLLPEEMFGRFSAGPPRQFSTMELIAQGQKPTPRYGSGQHWMDQGRANPMVEMQELQAMREMLSRLKRQRGQAKSQTEVDEIDMDIAVLERDLGLRHW